MPSAASSPWESPNCSPATGSDRPTTVPPVRTVHLLVNPSARRGAVDGDTVRTLLTERGLRVEILDPDGPDDVAAVIERSAPDRVIAVGGDGLVHRALPALVGTGVELGLVPSGTGNDFARALGLPRRRRTAVERSLGSTTDVDVLSVRFTDGISSYAATIVTAGFSGRVNRTANERTFPRGQLKYTAASFTELRRLSSFPLEVRGLSDELDHTLSGPCALLAVANTRYFGGGMAIAPEADPTNGLFDIAIVGAVPAWQLGLVLPAVFIGQHVRHPKVFVVSGRAASFDQPEDVWADGERIGSGPFAVEIVEAGLRIAAL